MLGRVGTISIKLFLRLSMPVGPKILKMMYVSMRILRMLCWGSFRSKLKDYENKWHWVCQASLVGSYNNELFKLKMCKKCKKTFVTNNKQSRRNFSNKRHKFIKTKQWFKNKKADYWNKSKRNKNNKDFINKTSKLCWKNWRKCNKRFFTVINNNKLLYKRLNS